MTNASLRIYFRVNPGSCQDDIDVRIYQPNGYSIDFPAAIGGTCSTSYPLYNILLPIPDFMIDGYASDWHIQVNDQSDDLSGAEFSVRAAVLYYDYALLPTTEEDCGSGLLANTVRSITSSLYEVSVFPNPVLDELTIKTAGDATIENVTLLNTQGQEIRSTINTTINMNDLAPGVYFVVVRLKDGYFTTKRIVKMGN